MTPIRRFPPCFVARTLILGAPQSSLPVILSFLFCMCHTASLNTAFRCGCSAPREVLRVDCGKPQCSLSKVHRASGHVCSPSCAAQRGRNFHLLDESAMYDCEKCGGPSQRFAGP